MRKVLVVLVVLVSAMFAEQTDMLKRMMKDMKGWEAEEAQAMSFDMSGMKMSSVTREYSNDDAVFTVTVMAGTRTMLDAQVPQMSIESDDMSWKVDDIDGFKVMRSFEKKEKQGAIMINLEKKEKEGALLIFSFENMTMEDALKMSKDWDWKAFSKESLNLIK